MDFIKFCEQYGQISHKATGKKMSLKLNGAQKVVYDYLEKCRLNKVPCRLLILKSRQLGISTLLEYYFSWLLIFHYELETFLSLCHNKQLSKSFVSTMINIYTRYCKEKKPKPAGDNIYEDSKGNHLIYGSAKNYNAMRGFNIGIAHLSESAFWHSKSSDWSEEVIRSVMGSVGNRPGTFVVMESTSDGRNNYFYKLWCDSIAGITSYFPIFVGWNLCEYYSLSLNKEDEENIKKLTQKEENLLKNGYTIEQLNWYRHKRMEFQDETSFLREFPCNPEESFTSSSNEVFSQEELALYQDMIKTPRLVNFGRELDGNIICLQGSNYNLWINNTGTRKRFYVVVTIGSTIDDAEFNVITAWSYLHGTLFLCLERRYLSDLDTLIEDSITVSKYYNNAMLIVELNSMNKLGLSSKEYYIRKIKKRYSRLFVEDGNIGYNMTRKRKLRGLFAFRRMLRENKIRDYSELTLNEMQNFIMEDEELKPSLDHHDDCLLCRLILCDVIDEYGPRSEPLNPNEFIKHYYLS